MSTVIHYDAHFHFQTSNNWLRNFLFNRSIKERQKIWWDAFSHRSRQIQLIVSTEHAYANPEESYRLLKDSKPKDYEAVVLPGVEAITKEGIDVIVFSPSEEIFKDDDILAPCKHSIFDLVDIVDKNPDYQGILAHPFGATPNAAWPRISIPEIQEVAEGLGMVERYNFTAHGMYTKRGFVSKAVGNVAYRILTGEAPHFANGNLEKLVDYCKENNVGFSVGSDAHNPQDLKCFGSLAIAGELTNESAYEALKNNKDDKWGHPEHYSKDKPLHTLVRTNSRLIEEYGYFRWLMKKVAQGDDKAIAEFYKDINEWFAPDNTPTRKEFFSYMKKQGLRVLEGYNPFK